MDLNGKTVVVIGAGSGIDRAVAVDGAGAGATSILGGRTAAPLEETVRLAGGTVRVVDASREEEAQAFFESIGSFDHLVSTIGAGASGPIVELRGIPFWPTRRWPAPGGPPALEFIAIPESPGRGDRVPVADKKERTMSAHERLNSPALTQADFARDAGVLCEKFTGLARVMSGKYGWKPAQGVRSVAEIFNLIVKENGLLAGVLSGTPNPGASPAPITDPEQLQEALKTSYLNLQEAIAEPSDTDLHAPVKLFGRDMTKQGALMLILGDQHEHLGQSIAYARANGVVPPWSK